MKILKSNTNQIFDTENPSVIEFCKDKSVLKTNPLHHQNDLTDYEFLKKYFPLNHEIFSDFGSSYFYSI